MATERAAPVTRRNSAGLARDIELLELIGGGESAESNGLSVVRLAQLTGRDKSVVSRAMATLAAAGLVERDPETLSYRLGTRLFTLAARTAESTLVRASRDYIRRIAQATRETTHLCVLRGGSVLTLVSELSPYEVRTTGWEGIATAAWRTPSGRVLISDWTVEALEDWYAVHGQDAPILGPVDPAMARAGFSVLPQPPKEKAVVTDFPSLLAELTRIRRRGYATLEGELELGVVGVSAPVRDFNGRIVAAINVSAPQARLGHQLPKLGAFVAKAARDLSKEIGLTSTVLVPHGDGWQSVEDGSGLGGDGGVGGDLVAVDVDEDRAQWP